MHANRAECDDVLYQFEGAWGAAGAPVPDLRGFLLSLDRRLRAPVLPDLVHIDLERRLKAGLPARVRDYVRDYPELAADPDLLCGLLKEEFRLRERGIPV